MADERQFTFYSARTQDLSTVVVRIPVVPVVQEPEPVGDAESVANRRDERRDEVRPYHDLVVGLQINVRLLAGEDLRQVNHREDFAILILEAADDLSALR